MMRVNQRLIQIQHHYLLAHFFCNKYQIIVIDKNKLTHIYSPTITAETNLVASVTRVIVEHYHIGWSDVIRSTKFKSQNGDYSFALSFKRKAIKTGEC